MCGASQHNKLPCCSGRLEHTACGPMLALFSHSHERYQGTSPQPPGAAALLLEQLLGVTVRTSILAHSTFSQLPSTRPPVSPELAFQHLHSDHKLAVWQISTHNRSCTRSRVSAVNPWLA